MQTAGKNIVLITVGKLFPQIMFFFFKKATLKFNTREMTF